MSRNNFGEGVRRISATLQGIRGTRNITTAVDQRDEYYNATEHIQVEIWDCHGSDCENCSSAM